MFAGLSVAHAIISGKEKIGRFGSLAMYPHCPAQIPIAELIARLLLLL